MSYKIKTKFSIKDLENLSGIKAHTIRIWEKRYNLLNPDRTSTNIRNYNTTSLKRLLNISYLNNKGLKISQIACLNDEEINIKVNEFIISQGLNDHAHNLFKMAMLNFDKVLFNNTYNQLLSELSFREIFTNTFARLFDDIGILWQTDTILPVHEHFISNLVKQKIFLNIEKSEPLDISKKMTYVLFLPDHEIHEIGLLFIYSELIMRGYHAIYLGQSVPMSSLEELQNVFTNVEFISYFTIAPTTKEVSKYLLDIQEKILSGRNQNLHILGRNTNSNMITNKNIKVHKNSSDLLKHI
tara:strand:- start:996 stop:1889 length:894 start_codon:yes stop_codon:yes gene_type:complete